ncbi:biotin carboxyl carrier protein [Propylenella binzhouense]|uniref:biotin carboxyl carrier protein n=1 Tax=Propylenella binzhouense TaxID=2555902 RepID=UPI00136D97AA
MNVDFIDTTFRDGHQSLWAFGMRSGMMEAVAEDMDNAGFKAIEVPILGIFIKKCIRDLKEDYWELARVLARKMPRTPKVGLGGAFILPFELGTPRSVIELYYRHLAELGVVDRMQVTCNTLDQIKRALPWIVPMLRGVGLEVVLALSYTISPRHTDAYYAETTRRLLPFKPDAIYLKDQGGLLTVDRARTLLPTIVANADGIPVELHSHCTTGQAEMVYLEAMRLGISTLHTAVPPLANGPSQPSVLNVARNARILGYSTSVDDALLQSVSERLTAFARADGMPIGAPLEHDAAQYVHQVPGGVISNLKYQLAELGIQDRLDEVLEECVQVRKDLGYPIMITPLSQYVVTQAAINVAKGERYKLVIDEVLLHALGVFGEDSGYTWMDQDLRDRFLSLPRAEELKKRPNMDVPLEDIREKLGGPDLSDEELLLRYVMKGDQEIRAMRAAGPPRRYHAGLPLAGLVEELGKHKGVRYVQVQRGGDQLVVRNRSSAV